MERVRITQWLTSSSRLEQKAAVQLVKMNENSGALGTLINNNMSDDALKKKKER